jgi:hypothetical protein
VLGHLRHEIAHYYEDILAPEGSAERGECREIFGDDRDDYAAAMDRHYAQGAPAGWQESFVSAYATMHPWEDWAETFAHYLHIRDTLQTAQAYGVRVAGPQVATTDRAPLHSDPGARAHRSPRAGGGARADRSAAPIMMVGCRPPSRPPTSSATTSCSARRCAGRARPCSSAS